MIDRVNDAHVHIGQSKEINQTLPPLKKFKEANNIEKCLIFGFDDSTRDKLITLDKYSDDNNYALKWCDDYVSGWYDEFHGVKFHGSYLKKPVSHDDFKSHMDYLNRNKKILLVHCGMFKDGDLDSITSFFHAIQVAQEYENIQVILGHMGGSVTPVVKRCIDYLERNPEPNIWLETSGITTPYVVEYAVEKLGDRKILFGSDSPWCSFNAMRANVMDAQIEDISKELIMYHNFNSLLKRCGL